VREERWVRGPDASDAGKGVMSLEGQWVGKYEWVGAQASMPWMHVQTKSRKYEKGVVLHVEVPEGARGQGLASAEAEDT